MYEPIVERSVVQQLDDLPDGSVVIDRDGDAWQKRESGWIAALGPEDDEWDSGEEAYVSTSRLAGTWAPLHLVYNPDHRR